MITFSLQTLLQNTGTTCNRILIIKYTSKENHVCDVERGLRLSTILYYVNYHKLSIASFTLDFNKSISIHDTVVCQYQILW